MTSPLPPKSPLTAAREPVAKVSFGAIGLRVCLVIGFLLGLIGICAWMRPPNDPADSNRLKGETAAVEAEIQFRQNNRQRAIALAEQAAQLQPARTDRWFRLAEYYDRTNNWQAMIGPLKRILTLEPENYEAHAQLAYAFHAIGNLNEARPLAEWCVKKEPNDVFPTRLLAAIARDEAEMELAETYVRRALLISPRDVESRIVEADLLMFRRDPETAYQRLSEIQEGQSSFRYLGALARAAAATGRIREAAAIASELERRQSTVPRRRVTGQ